MLARIARPNNSGRGAVSKRMLGGIEELGEKEKGALSSILQLFRTKEKTQEGVLLAFILEEGQLKDVLTCSGRLGYSKQELVGKKGFDHVMGLCGGPIRNTRSEFNMFVVTADVALESGEKIEVDVYVAEPSMGRKLIFVYERKG